MKQTAKRAVLIPARGGSKRLPRKNIMDFEGRPMLVHTIECARKSGLFQDIHVSTEDGEIGEMAERHGASWVRRSESLATDRSTVVEVCLDFLNRERKCGRVYESLTVLYPAVPLRQPEDIVAVMDLIENRGGNFAMTVTEYPYDPFEALVMEADGSAHLWMPDMADVPRQDRPVLRIDIGSVYAVRVAAFEELSSFYGPGLKLVQIPPERAVDIDVEDDLLRARFNAEFLCKRDRIEKK